MALKMEEISVGYYEDIIVLSDFTMYAKGGEITTIIGPNGAGKSTVLKTIYGFLRPNKGRVLLNNRDITTIPPYKMPQEGVAFIMQERGIFPEMSVEENLQLGCWLFKGDREKVMLAIDNVYNRYPILKDRKEVYAGNLSGGEQRILELGKALLINPSVMLLDEPTAGLAPIAANLIFDEISRLKEEKKTILMVEQNVKKAMNITDYVYVVELGRVNFHAEREQIDLHKAITPWVNW